MDIPAIVREKAGDFEEKALQEYVVKVNKMLEGMKSGDIITIVNVTKPQTRDLFIETVKFYMREHEWQDGLSFAKGFTELRKYDLEFITRQKIVSTQET